MFKKEDKKGKEDQGSAAFEDRSVCFSIREYRRSKLTQRFKAIFPGLFEHPLTSFFHQA